MAMILPARLKELAEQSHGELSECARELLKARKLIDAVNKMGEWKKFPPDVEQLMIEFRRARAGIYP